MALASRTVTIRETAWIDYVLTAVLGSLALFTLGQGIAQPVVGIITGSIYCIGTGVSFLIAIRVRGTKFAGYDAMIYGCIALFAVFGQPLLNQLLPEDSFPIELRSAGMVTWLLSLGSFAAWRDATRLFQAVPALALFGLVGVYDTYPAAPFIFFGYLLCLALMFGRAHARSMLLQATLSGFAKIEEGIALSESGADRDSVLRAMRRGPWRWMAGPEWAVASAGAVILVSLFGAPIIHDQVKGVAANIHLNVPSRMLNQPRSQTTALTTESLKRIGTGPRHLTNTQVGLATLDRVRYLRTAIYEAYTVGSWATAPEQVQSLDPNARRAALDAIVKPREFNFTIQMQDLISGRSLPAPSEVKLVTDPPDALVMNDGTVRVGGNSMAGTAIESTLTFDDSLPTANRKARAVHPDQRVSDPVLQRFVDEVTAGCKTDFEKANKLMQAIAAHAKYNLKATAVPRDSDPIEYFLFTSHEGYCDLFASAMVVLARDAGMDAHYVIGYLPGTNDRDEYGRYVLRQSDAHAWAEIYFEGIGWVVYDPTSLAEDITPGVDGPGGKLGLLWIPIVLVLGGLAALVYYGPRFRARGSLTRSSLQQRQLASVYAKFAQDLSRRSKLQKPAAASPDRWLEMTGPSLGRARDEAERVTKAFVVAMYANGDLDDSRIGELRQEVKRFRRLKS